MTEQEIIEYLKENKNKGVAFMLMPQEVKEWCKEHEDEATFSRLTSAGWDYAKRKINTLDKDAVYFLRDYEPEPQFKPHYEEFDVDENGFFRILKESESIYYQWFNWQKFIEENFDKYNNFGGWLYNNKLWSTKVLMTDVDKRDTIGYLSKDKTVVPITPTKIRFWRYRE